MEVRDFISRTFGQGREVNRAIYCFLRYPVVKFLVLKMQLNQAERRTFRVGLSCFFNSIIEEPETIEISSICYQEMEVEE